MKHLLLIITLHLFLFSCSQKSSDTSQKVFVNISKDIHDIKSKDLEKYYRYDSIYSRYFIDSLLLDKPVYFDDNEIHFSIKENNFPEYEIVQGQRYYLLDSFSSGNDKTYRLIIYLTNGENDTNILNIKLNSYNKNQLIDALLLDQRFTFENSYYRDFSIEAGHRTIEINKYKKEYFLYNEDEGDIIGERETPLVNSSKVKYTINTQSGIFDLLE